MLLILRCEFITIIIRQFPTKQGVSCALAFYLSFLFFALALEWNQSSFVIVVLEKGNNFWLAYVHYIQEGKENPNGSEQHCGDLPPVF